MKLRALVRIVPLVAALALFSHPASAFVGLFVGKQPGKRVNHASFVVVMRDGGTTAVTVMNDYEGPLDDFALVMPVPSDVAVDHIKMIKRDLMDRIDSITAPRFHEFWEEDPCDPTAPIQQWEQSRKASNATAFLGGGSSIGPEKPVPKEMLANITPEFNAGEYTFSILDDSDASDFDGWLKKQGYQVLSGAAHAVAPYVKAGMKLLVAHVDSRKIELEGGGRAMLSPFRFYTEKPFDTIPERIGLLNIDKKQELIVYVLDPNARYETKNYENVYPPTNIQVDFKVKERVGEFYAALQDLIAKQHPKAFLDEYAWPTTGCGRPCPDEPLDVGELLTFGGDVFEQALPKSELNPKPPPLTDAEKKQLKGLKGKDKKQFEADRKELARRKALIARQKYVLSRLDYRFDAQTLPEDVKIGPTGAVQGGVGVPKGRQAAVPTAVTPAKDNELQTRYINLHPWKGMMKCASPDRWRWGIPPRTYRGLRKIWIAKDLTRKSRTEIKPAAVVVTPIPALGLSGHPSPTAAHPAARDAGTDAGPSAAKKSSRCGCSVPGGSAPLSLSGVLCAALGAGLIARRRKKGTGRALPCREPSGE
jgi:hypothetical protein